MAGNSATIVDFGWICVAYASALVVAAFTVWALPGLEPLWRAAAADVAATLVVFAFSRYFDNSSFYDAYWSVAPPFLAAYCWWSSTSAPADRSPVAAVLGVLIVLWAVRLTHNWARGWRGLNHVDWRYVDLRASTGRWFFFVDLAGIHMLPTVWVFLGCLPLWLMAAQGDLTWQAADWLWVLLGFSALALEFRADNVLRAFRCNEANVGQVLRQDVWAWCRHPNYLGELGFWLALAIADYVHTLNWLSWLGFVLMVALFVGISIPMIDRRQLANKPGYRAYHREVPALLPGFKRS